MIYVHNKFQRDWFSHSNVDKGGIHRHTELGDRISLLLFFQNKETSVKTLVSICKSRPSELCSIHPGSQTNLFCLYEQAAVASNG
jgi:hypothetical protein